MLRGLCLLLVCDLLCLCLLPAWVQGCHSAADCVAALLQGLRLRCRPTPGVQYALCQSRLPADTCLGTDEIDAIGTKRYDSQSGGEREIQRTMLELLNQMDGFDSMGDVKVLPPSCWPLSGTAGCQHLQQVVTGLCCVELCGALSKTEDLTPASQPCLDLPILLQHECNKTAL